MKTKLALVLFLLVFAGSAFADGTDDWLKNKKKAAGGKEVEGSYLMKELLDKTADSIKDKKGKGICEGEALDRAWYIVQDEANLVVARAFGKADIELMKTIIKIPGLAEELGEMTVKEAMDKLQDITKEEVKDRIKGAIKKALEKEKPEVYTRQGSKSGCSWALVAIWDKAAGQYKISVHAECAPPDGIPCKRDSSQLLHSFDIDGTGRVSVSFDKHNVISVHADTAIITPHAVCTRKVVIEKPLLRYPGPKPGGGDAPPSNGGKKAVGASDSGVKPVSPGPPGGVTPPPPDSCRPAKPSCKDCEPIYEAIDKACKRITELEDEKAAPQSEMAKITSKGTLSDADQERTDALQKEIGKKQAEIRVLNGKIGELTEELQKCEQKPCPPPSSAVQIQQVIPRAGYNPFNPFYDPFGFVGSTPPPPSNKCVYTYSDWGPCQSNNTQTRTVISSSPPGCTGTPIVGQSCTSTQPPTAAPSHTISQTSETLTHIKGTTGCPTPFSPLTITNTGNTALLWSANNPMPFVSLDKSTGTIPVGGTGTTNPSFPCSGYSMGANTGTLHFTITDPQSGKPSTGPSDVNFSLTVK